MLDILRSYITCKTKTEYAYLLTGDWGCGKSYFIEYNKDFNEILSEAEKKLVVVSVNGMTSIDSALKQIKNTIILSQLTSQKGRTTIGKIKNSIYSFYKKLADKMKDNKNAAKVFDAIDVAKSIYDIAYPDFEKNILNDCVQKIVLIIDDLERLSETVKTTDFLGQLHLEILSIGIKTIIIADESKIVDGDYTNEKEKYIRRTVKFKNDKIEVFRILLMREDNNEKRYSFCNDNNLTHFMEITHEIYFNNPRPNLRTVIFAFDIIEELYLKCKAEKIQLSDYVFNKLFYNMVVYAILAKDEKIDKDSDLRSHEKNGFSLYEIYKHCSVEGCELDTHSDWIKNFVYDGRLDMDVFKLWVSCNNKIEVQCFISKFSSYPFISDREIKSITKNFYNNLKAKAYNAEDLLFDKYIIENIKTCLRIFENIDNEEFNELFYDSITSEENEPVLLSYFGMYSDFESDHLFFSLFPELKARIKQYINDHPYERKNAVERFYNDIKDRKTSSLQGYFDINNDILDLAQKYDDFERLFSLKNDELFGLHFYLSKCIRGYGGNSKVLERLREKNEENITLLEKSGNFQRLDVLKQLSKDLDILLAERDN